MAAYEGTSDGGAGGKFRKRPFRRSQTTPYDRPPTALRPTQNPNNNNNNGWLSKIVDPASKLITAGAHKLFFSVFRKRLLPPPPQQPPDERKEFEDMQPAAVTAATHVVTSATEEPVGGGGNNTCRSSDGNSVGELEDILKQKTFTRSEIDHLTSLLLSRTAEKSDDADPVRARPNPSHLPVVQTGREKPSTFRNREFRIEHVLPEAISTPEVRSKVSQDVASSPAEIAKAYMGSRSARPPLSLSSQNQVPKEDLPSPYDPFSKQTSPAMSLIRKPFNDCGASSNGLMTPRFRGRSAIYSMARSPYSRAHSVMDIKASETKFDVSGGSSLFRNGTESNLSERQVLKRRSSVLENDIGSVGPIRRIRQKPNLLHPKILSLPPPGGCIASNAPGRLTDGEGPSSVEQRSQNHSSQKALMESTALSSSNGYVPSQTMQTVQKIFEQLDNFTPKRSPEKKTDVSSGNSPTKMKSSMLNGSARESREAETSSRALQGTHDSKRVNGVLNSITAHHSPSSRTEDVSLKKLVIPSGNLPSQNGVEYSNAVSHVTSKIKTAEYMVPVSGVEQPQKKRAFQMSALEDCPELDDDVPSNEVILSNPLTDGRRYGDAPKSIGITDTIPHNKGEKPPLSEPAAGLFLRKEPESQANTPAVAKTVSFGSTLAPSSAPPTRMTEQEIGSAPQMTLKADTSGSHNESNNTFSSFFKSDKLPSSSFATSPSALASAAIKDTKSETLSSANVAAATSNGADENGTKSVQGSADLFMKSGDFSPAVCSAKGAFTFGMQTSKATASKELQPDGAVPTTNQSSDHAVVSSSLVPGGIQVSIGSIGPSPTSAAADAGTLIFAANSSNGTAVPASNSDLSSTPVPSFSASKFPSTSAASADIIQTSGPKSDDTGFVKTANIFSVNPSASVSSGNYMSATLKSSGVDAQTAAPTSSGVPFRFQTTAASASELAPSFGLAVSSVSAPISTSSSSIFGNSIPSFSTSVSSLGVPASFSSGAISGSTAANPFSSLSSTSSLLGSTPSSTGSLSTTASVSTSNVAGVVFGWQPSKSTTPETTSTSALTTTNGVSFGIGSSGSSGAASNSFIFGAAAKSSSSNSSPFIFGSSSGSAPSIFAAPSSATSTPAMSSPLFQSQQPFGSTNPQPLTFGLNPSTNNNQVTMEDSMAEDSVQPSTPPILGFGAPSSSSVPAFGAQASVPAFGAPVPTPSVPPFGQPPVSASPGGFSFSASTPPAAGNSFQFMGQQNQFAPANAPFQSSGSVEFNGGQGSFSLGTNGGDKSQRRFVKPRKKVGRK